MMVPHKNQIFNLQIGDWIGGVLTSDDEEQEKAPGCPK